MTTYTTVAAVLGQRPLEIGHLVPINVAQTAMAFFQTLRLLILRNARQRGQPKHLQHDLAYFERRELATQLYPLTDKRVASLKYARVASTGNVLEIDKGASERPIRFEMASKVLRQAVRRLRYLLLNRRWRGCGHL